ncbi:ciliary microtubule inner protein 2A [Lathamus discolor]|uniref:ciliary microtubule inner protein 2A n=1 Tax=Lathamus discolor TaxID=678569 RepID=UPI0032B7EDCC
MAASKENSIFPSHPYHIPGYGGFIPQYSFQSGETFGRATHRLLTDPAIARSPRALLAPLQEQELIEDFSGAKHGGHGHLPGHPGGAEKVLALCERCSAVTGASLREQRCGTDPAGFPAKSQLFRPKCLVPVEQTQKRLQQQQLSHDPSLGDTWAVYHATRTPWLDGSLGGPTAPTGCVHSLRDAAERQAPFLHYRGLRSRPRLPRLKPELAEEELTMTMMQMDPEPWDHPGEHIPRTQVAREYPRTVPSYPVSGEREWLTRRCGSGQLGGAWAGSAPGRVPLPPPTQEPVGANGAEEEAIWLPETDLPNVSQPKVITGYAGFIPRLSWFHGMNYIRSVKEAMKEFDQHQVMLRNPCYSFGKRYPQNYWPTNRIYTSAGLIPSYMGFVPELRNTYALTYGNSTRKAYQKEQERRARAL